MRTKAYQTFLILFFIGLLAAGAVWAAVILTPLVKIMTGDFYVVAGLVLWTVLFIAFSSTIIRILLAIKPLPIGADVALASNRSFYWKFIGMVTEIGGMTFLPFISSFLHPLFYKLFGAKIGKGVIISGFIADPYLVAIGDYSIIGQKSIIVAHNLTCGRIKLNPIGIEKNVTVGVGAIIMPGVEIGEGSVVAANAVVTRDMKIPPYELWGGVLARKIKDIEKIQTEQG